MSESNKLSKQEIFDRGARHLLTQKKRSTNAAGNLCLYRSADGCKCVVGAFIPDDVYNPSMEGKPIGLLFSTGYVHTLMKLGLNAVDHFKFLIELQNIHDGVKDVTLWPRELKKFADKYNLNSEVLNEFQGEFGAL